MPWLPLLWWTLVTWDHLGFAVRAPQSTWLTLAVCFMALSAMLAPHKHRKMSSCYGQLLGGGVQYSGTRWENSPTKTGENGLAKTGKMVLQKQEK